jgi:hypothetical protein
METIEAPFVTQNVKLAFAIYSAGVPFYKTPLVNTYTASKLKELGYTGQPIEEAARDAFSKNKAGHVAYSFNRTAELKSIIEAFDHAQKQVDSDELFDFAESLGRIITEFETGDITRAQFIAKNIALTLDARKAFLGLWRTHTPMIRVNKAGSPVTRDGANGGKVVTHPGYIEYSLNASPETRQRLGL